ncbi:MAG: hypothetical protein CSB47_05975 [Proteobacteria bacterium]|nr:MAG: hypothetical protein CSB47_05975 [Pseudomonadota bacterium]
MRITDWLGAKTFSFLMLILVLFTTQLSAKTTAGTVITNQAEVFWFDTEDGKVKHAYSNVSSVVVREQYALILVPDNVRYARSSQRIDLPHRLINTGNTPSDYILRVRHDMGDSGNLEDTRLYGDTNANGVVDKGEPLWETVPCEPLEDNVSCYYIPEMKPGDVTEFTITGTTLANAVKGDMYRMNVRTYPVKYGEILAGSFNGVERNAKAVPSGGAALSAADIAVTALPEEWVNDDRIYITSGAILKINKTVNPICGVPVKTGDSIRYAINFTNVGDDLPHAKDISIDGQMLEGLLLEDVLPANVTFSKLPSPISAPNQSIILVQRKNDENTNRWISLAQWDGEDVISKVGLYIPGNQIQPNQSGKLEFDVTVNRNVTTATIYNQAKFDLEDDSNTVFLSNSVCTSIEPESSGGGEGEHPTPEFDATIRFLTPTLDIKKNLTQGGEAPDFYNDSHFEDASIYHLNSNSDSYNVARDGVYIELTSSAVNKTEDEAEVIVVTVKSGTGDTLQVTLLETGPNTGVFRSLSPIVISENTHGNGQSCPAAGTVGPDFSGSQESCILNGAADGNLNVTVSVDIDGHTVKALKDDALIDPLGVVFDSAYNTPVAGATVWIRNADGSVALNPLTDLPYEPQVTGDDGRYRFPFLIGGQDYYLDVDPPSQYSFPSVVSANSFGSGRVVNNSSYGVNGYEQIAGSGIFTLTSLLVVDIPLDPELDTDLTVHKTASVSEVGVGSSLSYAIRIQNHSGHRLYAVKIQDELPRGFKYVSGSATLDGTAVGDPEGVPGANLLFSNLPFIEGAADGLLDNAEHTLRYRVRVTAGAVGSSGINTAQSTGNTATGVPVESNETRAKVEIRRDGVLQGKGIIFGKVYVDTDCNNVQNGGEWPIGGVKLYLQDGTWVITDANGQYSVYGIEPGDHVIKMDPVTLPKGLVFKPTDNRQMADPESRLVDLKSGEFHRADFAAVCPKVNRDEIQAEIKARNAGQSDWMLENAQNYDPDRKLDGDGQRRTGERDGDISNGKDVNLTGFSGRSRNNKGNKQSLTTGYSIQLKQFREQALANKALSGLQDDLKKKAFVYQDGDFYTVRHGFDLDKKSANARMKTLKLAKDARIVATTYERISDEAADRIETPRGLALMPLAKEMVSTVTKSQAKKGVWLWPKGEVSLDGRFMVVVRKGVTPTLMLNGKAIPKSQMGEQIENRREKAQVVAWYGVPLQPGENKLEVVAKDMFGNNRTLAKGTFTRPVSAERMVLEKRADRLAADGGRSYLPITIKLLDANGYLARGVNFVTLQASDGQWVERDIQDQVQGRQVRVVNGLRTVHLRSSERSGKINVRATDGSMRAETQITQVAPLRPLIAVGILEVGGQLFNRDDNSPDKDIEDDFDSSAAVFMKGKVRGDMHLTLSVDTDKPDDAQLFRDINPNKSYPIHGDSSQRGYEAQSRSKVYAKLEKDKDSAMWGDFVTDNNSMNEDVTRVQRTLTGANLVTEGRFVDAQVFVSELNEENVVERIRGKGVALNYRLKTAPIVANSETIEIITVSRDNPGVVLNTKTLSRFGDYTLDNVTGELSFSETIAISDEDQNPVYIRATYDVDGDGDDYLVAGARLSREVMPGFKVGLSYTVDQHESKGFDLYGFTFDYDNNKGLEVRGSVGRMSHKKLNTKNGVAGRLYLSQKWKDKSLTSITLGRATEGFTNSAAGIAENREELRIKHRKAIYDGINAEIEAIHSKMLDSGHLEQSVGVTADTKVKDWTLKGGVRHIRQDNSSGKERFETFIVGAKKHVKIGKRKGSVEAEYEQDFDSTDRKRLAISADMEVHDNVKLYARGERIHSLSGVNGLSSEVSAKDTIAIGVKSNFFKSTELFSEYRVRGVIDGRDLETASGLRGNYELTKGLSISPHLEIVKNLDGDGSDSLAASIAIKDKRVTDQISALRLETRHDDDREYYGLQADYVRRLDSKWSVLLKDTLRYESPDLGDDLVDNKFTLGLAYRPRLDNKHHALFYYQNKESRGGDDGDCSTHILSTHQNYEINEDVLISGRLGGKQEECDGVESDAAVLDARMTWDLTNRLDVDVHAGVLATDGFDEKSYSVGAGVNYLVRKNLRVGVGYNLKGFKDEDLDPERYNDEGLYFGLKYKFDEKSLNWLAGE